MPKTNYETLKPLLGPGRDALIVIRPDPDSLASAWALSLLFKRNGSRAEIGLYEPIKRVENRTMVKLLRIPHRPLKEVKLEAIKSFCMVDGQPNQVLEFVRDEWDIIIDHHPLADGYAAKFADVRPEMGATASILNQYLLDAGIKTGARLATALSYGIITDTDYFQRKMTRDDALAISSLFPAVDYQALKMIEQTEVPRRYLDLFDLSLHRLKIQNRRAVVHIGAADSGDIAVILADFFIRVSGISFAAWSVVAGDKLVIVFRSHDVRKDAGAIAKERFGEFGSAGGHRGAARAEIPLASLPPEVKLYSHDSIEDFIKKKLTRPAKRANKT